MKKASHIGASLALSILIAATFALQVQAYESLRGPTELLHWDRAKAYSGYTLFGTRGRSYLIDMEGKVVHTWALGTSPQLLDNGHILDASRDDPSGTEGLKELDWEGKVVWEHRERREGYAAHHDWVRIFNKKLNAYTTLYIANKSVTHEQAIAAGADPRRGPYRGVQMDAIVEVDMDGKVVWEWWFFDHVVQDIDSTKPTYVGRGKTVADYPGRIDLNMPGHPLKRDWLHCNSLDYNAELGHVVTNSVHGEFYVIDHDGTFIANDPQRSVELAAGPAGDFLYRFGDPARYDQGDPPRILENWNNATSGHKQIGGSHDIRWIPPGLPGAGHLLIFNNGQYLFDRTSQSSILEINGFLDTRGRDTGRYVNPPDAGYERVEFDHDTHKPRKSVSRQVVWSYQSKSNQGFFSHIGSGAQRLPNSNTLICAMTEGHLFEVTKDGEVVWEYINPVTRMGTLKVLPDSLPMTNAVFRAYRYGPDHPAFKGRELTPKGTITDAFPSGPDRRGGGDRQRRGDRRGRGRRGRDRDESRPRDRHTPRDDTRGAADGVVAPGARVAELADGCQFTEGPVADGEGNVFFTDVHASRIHKWSVDGRLSTFRTDTGGANGLCFDRNGNLLACEGDRGRVVSIDPRGNATVLADTYEGERFNKPNDLWIDPKGGVYFSDPIYGRARRAQDGEHVYYLTPDRKQVVRVIDDMVRPNGLVGTPDGKVLYATDHGTGKTYHYRITSDGTLSGKTLFVPVGSDGMTIDSEGNVYLTENAVLVFGPNGKQIERIDVPERPTNVCFGARDGKTLFITARGSIHSLRMRVSGVAPSVQTAGARSAAVMAPRDDVAPKKTVKPEPRPGRSRNPIMLALDVNEDGRISADELRNAPAALRKLDRDGDGVIRKDEMLSEITRLFGKVDMNRDGKLAADEYAIGRARTGAQRGRR